ncbi:MAG: class I tRNA ligase family protein [Chthoniobacterales bacterium]|nr:class I tRNA ligase family protein [Chthoniobacterales bacterium]
MKPYFITTAIDYTNAPPHIGHAYEKIVADVLARYQRLQGREVFFLTGVDQHGQKVQQAAEKQGVSPQVFVDQISHQFIELWRTLSISYDAWAATTHPHHGAVVQQVLSKLFAEGWLYKASYEGHYSIRQEQFLTDKERDAAGNFGPEWGEVTFLKEENWYFRLSGCCEWLAQFLEKHPEFVTPSFRQSELKNAAAKITGDLCISRPKSRLTWGITFPFDANFVTYVWFDALLNYLSFAGYSPGEESSKNPDFSKRWPCNYHLIGKDILIPAHGVYWPCMLHAMGFSDDQMPKLLVHGFWTMRGEKISKSTGNVFDLTKTIEHYGASALRYYLMRDVVMGRDADFNQERLLNRYHSELSNGLGNLLNRTVSMTHRYRPEGIRAVTLPKECAELLLENQAALTKYCAEMEASQIHAGLEIMVDIVNRANAFVDTTAPWKVAKDSAAADRLDGILTTLIQSTRTAATLLIPVAPDAAAAILEQLQLEPLSLNHKIALPSLPPNYKPGAAKPLFPRIVEEAS